MPGNTSVDAQGKVTCSAVPSTNAWKTCLVGCTAAGLPSPAIILNQLFRPLGIAKKSHCSKNRLIAEPQVAINAAGGMLTLPLLRLVLRRGCHASESRDASIGSISPGGRLPRIRSGAVGRRCPDGHLRFRALFALR